MSYLDIVLLIIVICGFIFGFIGRAPRKVLRLFIVIISLVAAYFVSKYFMLGFITNFRFSSVGLSVAGDPTIPEYLKAVIKSNETIASAYDNAPAMEAFISETVAVLSYYISGIGCLIILSIFGNLIFGLIIKHNSKPGTAYKTLGLVNLVKSVILSLFLALPFITLSPILKNLDTIMGESASTSIKNLSRDLNDSKVLEFTDGFLSSTSISSLKYKDADNNELYYFDEEEGITSLVSLYATINGDSDTSILNLDTNELSSYFSSISDSMAAKEMLVSVINSEAGASLDVSTFSLKKEAGYITDIIELKDAEEFTKGNITTMISALSSSELMPIIANENEGILKNIPDGAKTGVKTGLAEKLSDGEITEDKYNALLKLFD